MCVCVCVWGGGTNEGGEVINYLYIFDLRGFDIYTPDLLFNVLVLSSLSMR